MRTRIAVSARRRGREVRITGRVTLSEDA